MLGTAQRKIENGRVKVAFADEYSLLEIGILDRNARGLSSVSLDLRATETLLSNFTKCRLCLRVIFDIHANHDLRRYPLLLTMTLDYFKRYPHAVEDLVDKTHVGLLQDLQRQYP